MSTVQVHVTESVLADAEALAASDRMAVDEFLARCLSDHIASLKGLAYLRERGRRGDREKFLAVLAKSPRVPPVPGDEVD